MKPSMIGTCEIERLSRCGPSHQAIHFKHIACKNTCVKDAPVHFIKAGRFFGCGVSVEPKGSSDEQDEH